MGSSGEGIPLTARDYYLMTPQEIPTTLDAAGLMPEDETFLSKRTEFQGLGPEMQGRVRHQYLFELRNLPDLDDHPLAAGESDRTRAFERACDNLGIDVIPPVAPSDTQDRYAVASSAVTHPQENGIARYFAEAGEGPKDAHATIKIEGKNGTVTISREIYDFVQSYNKAHPGAEIDIERVPSLLFGASGIKMQRKLLKTIETEFTVDKVEQWLKTDAGKRWFFANEAAIGKTLRGRVLVTSGPAMIASIGMMLGAEKLADVLGLDPVRYRQERFALVVYLMHAGGAGVRAGMQYGLRAALGDTAFVLKGVNPTQVKNGAAGLEFALEARTVFGREALKSMWKGLTLGKAAFYTGKGLAAIVKMPFVAGWNMGTGLAAQDITMTILRQIFPNMSESTASTVGFGAFMIPEALEMFVGREAAASILAKSGLRALGYVYAACFLFDNGFGIYRRVRYGNTAATYMTDVERRVGDRWMESALNTARAEDHFYARYPLLAGLHTADFFRNHLLHASFNAYINSVGDVDPYSRDVISEDTRQSLAQQRLMPRHLQDVLLKGVGDESNHPEFYRNLSFSALESEMTLSGDVLRLSSSIQRLRQDLSHGKMTAAQYEQSLREKAQTIFADPKQAQRVAQLSVMGASIRQMQDPSQAQGKTPPVELMIEGLKQEELAAAIDAESERLFPNPQDREAALRTIRAYELQQGMRTLHTISIPENASWKAMTGSEGELKSDAASHQQLLSVVFQGSKLTRFEEQRDALLNSRRASLLERIFDASGDERKKLLNLAREVGLTDTTGELKRDQNYEVATLNWAVRMRASGKRGQETLLAREHEVTTQLFGMRDQDPRAQGLRRELNALMASAAVLEGQNPSR